MSKRPDIPVFFKSVLQGIAHWVNYKAQYYRGHLLSEGALVGELTQLLAATVVQPSQVRCEQLYKNFGASELGQQRVDLAIGKPESSHNSNLKTAGLLAIEVKRFSKATWAKVEEDFHKLQELKKTVPSCRSFQLIIGQTDRPDRLFNKNHEMKKSPVFRSEDFHSVPRMSKKSFSTKRQSERGAFAVLLEILPA